MYQNSQNFLLYHIIIITAQGHTHRLKTVSLTCSCPVKNYDRNIKTKNVIKRLHSTSIMRSGTYVCLSPPSEIV